MIWLARWLAGATAPKLIALGVFSWLLGSQVSVSNVLLNALVVSSPSLFNLPQFLISAFLNTGILVKLAALIFGLTVLVVLLDLNRRLLALAGWRRTTVRA